MRGAADGAAAAGAAAAGAALGCLGRFGGFLQAARGQCYEDRGGRRPTRQSGCGVADLAKPEARNVARTMSQDIGYVYGTCSTGHNIYCKWEGAT